MALYPTNVLLEDREWFREVYRRHVTEQSPRWMAIRSRVMERAHGWCEGCGAAPATEVHHLTYEHLGDELLWELVAVCDQCHRKAHDLEGGSLSVFQNSQLQEGISDDHRG